MKVLIVYHANCIDGITAAAVTHKYCTEQLPDTDEADVATWAMSYDDSILPLQESIVKEGVERLYIVDFSFDLVSLHNLAYYCPCVRLLDHHASAFRNLMEEGYKVKEDSNERHYLPNKDGSTSDIEIILDNRESGASLCWKKLINAPDTFDDVAEMRLPTLIKYVKDYDLWQFTYPDTKSVNKYLKQVDKTVDKYLNLLEDFKSADFESYASEVGHTLMEYEHKIETAILESAVTPILINGVAGLAVNAPYEFASNLGNRLALMSNTFGAVWAQLADGKVSFSLRSIGDSCDVSTLAELMGGGGHKNASGFSLDSPGFDPEKGITLWSERAKNAVRGMATDIHDANRRAEEAGDGVAGDE